MLIDHLGAFQAKVEIATLLDGLMLLEQADMRDQLRRLSDKPTLHILGEKDQLLPSLIADDLKNLNPKHRINVVAGASHVPFISHADQVIKVLLEFLVGADLIHLHEPAVAKRAIALSFSKAANSYESAAGFQRQIAKELLARIESSNTVDLAIDLGCGTGANTSNLAIIYPRAQVWGVDIALGMLKCGVKNYSSVDKWICGDAERLPFADHSVDTLFSNLALQWCDDALEFMTEAARVLKPGGRFVFSTLGPNTFWELREAWRVVDDYIHVNNFILKEKLQAVAELVGFCMEELQDETRTVEYKEVTNFTDELKALGAHNINRGRARGLMGQTRYQKFISEYEKFRQPNGLLLATYQVYFCCFRLPD
jgi:malonyl-CoA O-methyltransferase